VIWDLWSVNSCPSPSVSLWSSKRETRTSSSHSSSSIKKKIFSLQIH
jgi:hypothetical protein